MSRKEFYIRRSGRRLTNEQRIVAYLKALRDVQAAKKQHERARRNTLGSLRRLRQIFTEHSKHSGSTNYNKGEIHKINSVIENMSDADVLALSNAVIATISADLASYPPLTEEDLAAKEKRNDFEDRLLAHDHDQAAALAATTRQRPSPARPSTPASGSTTPSTSRTPPPKQPRRQIRPIHPT